MAASIAPFGEGRTSRVSGGSVSSEPEESEYGCSGVVRPD
jgi:hypothetical protein